MSQLTINRFLVLLFFLLSAFSAALPGVATAAAGGRQEAPAITVEKTGPDISWTLKTPGKSGVVQVVLTLRDANNAPMLGKKLTGEVWMPAMPMPGYPLELDFYELQDGDYAALVQYAHGGLWQIKARFAGGEGKVHQESFDFTLAD